MKQTLTIARYILKSARRAVSLRSALAALLLASLTALHAADRPNIVIILADDYGAGSANCLGADRQLNRTPSIARLAAEGRRAYARLGAILPWATE